MTITNAQLAQDVSDLIASWDAFMEEFYAWLNGTVNGGPSNDGKYPLTDYAGNTQFLECPAKQADTVSNNVSGALAHKNAASTSESNAATSETNAATSEGNALSYRNAAQTAEANASADASAAANSASNAAASKASIDGRLTVSTSSPSGGSDGDIWFKIVGAGTHEIWVNDASTWKQFV